jgi:hypothetical protein
MLQAVRAGVLPCREIWMMMCNQAHIWIGCDKYLLQSKVQDRYHADNRRQQADFCDILPTALRPVRAGWCVRWIRAPRSGIKQRKVIYRLGRWPAVQALEKFSAGG